jgi:hypothetical protein
MIHFDRTLRTYADNGLRTVEDWASLAREIAPGQSPRAEADIHGKKIPLFVREQTTRRPARVRTQREPAPTPVEAPTA